MSAASVESGLVESVQLAEFSHGCEPHSSVSVSHVVPV